MSGESSFSHPDQHPGRLPGPRQSQACCPGPHPHSPVFCSPSTAGGAITICVAGIFTDAHLSHCSTHRRKQISTNSPAKCRTQPQSHCAHRHEVFVAPCKKAQKEKGNCVFSLEMLLKSLPILQGHILRKGTRVKGSLHRLLGDGQVPVTLKSRTVEQQLCG